MEWGDPGSLGGLTEQRDEGKGGMEQRKGMKANYPHPLLPNSRVCVCLFRNAVFPYGKKICEGGDISGRLVSGRCVYFGQTRLTGYERWYRNKSGEGYGMVLEDGGGENSPAFPLGLSVTADAPSFLLSPFLLPPPPPPPPPCRKLMGRRRVGGCGIRQTLGVRDVSF